MCAGVRGWMCADVRGWIMCAGVRDGCVLV